MTPQSIRAARSVLLPSEPPGKYPLLIRLDELLLLDNPTHDEAVELADILVSRGITDGQAIERYYAARERRDNRKGSQP